ncbi:MAG: AEC family transporter, partial [Pseudomonadota bacterium]
MDALITSVLPVFVLVVAGYAAGRSNYVAPETAKGLADFTFKLAIPALLFRTMATAELPDVAPGWIWLSYFLPVTTVWVATTFAVPLLLRRPLIDSAPIAMSASFGNVVMIGIPICLALIGDAASGPMAVIISLHSPVLWTLASLHLVLAQQGGGKPIGLYARELYNDLSKNIVLMAIVAGSLWRLTGIGLHPLADRTLGFLGQAAVPAALVSLGLSLVAFRIAGQAPTLALILIAKLVCVPLIAWLAAYELVGLEPSVAAVCVLFAAMPTGINAYLFASQHGRAQN